MLIFNGPSFIGVPPMNRPWNSGTGITLILHARIYTIKPEIITDYVIRGITSRLRHPLSGCFLYNATDTRFAILIPCNWFIGYCNYERV